MTGRPIQGPYCQHSDDEWCDDCFISSPVTRKTLRQLDREAYQPRVAVTDELLADARPTFADLIRDDPRPPATRYCVNGRHTDGRHHAASCSRPYPRASLVHRAVGAAVVGTLLVVGVTAALVVEAIEWCATDGRLHVEMAKRRAHAEWCRRAG